MSRQEPNIEMMKRVGLAIEQTNLHIHQQPSPVYEVAVSLGEAWEDEADSTTEQARFGAVSYVGFWVGLLYASMFGVGEFFDDTPDSGHEGEATVAGDDAAEGDSEQ